MLLAVLRMAPLCNGSILIDGVDVVSSACPISRRRIRSSLGIIPQDSWLFSGSLRSNLNVYNDYSDEQLLQALALVNLDAMVGCSRRSWCSYNHREHLGVTVVNRFEPLAASRCKPLQAALSRCKPLQAAVSHCKPP